VARRPGCGRYGLLAQPAAQGEATQGTGLCVGASVILADPIFQGLAISLMAGEIASLLISRMAVPVLYFMVYNRKPGIAAAPGTPEGP
jgi:hypothetical protein